MYKRGERIQPKENNPPTSVSTSPITVPEYDFAFKVNFIGDSGVGKSSYLYRLMNDQKPLPVHLSGSSYDCETKIFSVPILINGKEVQKKVKLTMYNVGDQRFRSYEHVTGKAFPLAIFFDPTERVSFNNVKSHYQKQSQLWQADKKQPAILISTKSELLTNRAAEEILDLALEYIAQEGNENYLGVVSISAKKNLNINEPMIQLAKHLVEQALKLSPEQAPKAVVTSEPITGSIVKSVTNLSNTWFNFSLAQSSRNLITSIAPYRSMTPVQKRAHILDILRNRHMAYVYEYCDGGRYIERLNEILTLGLDPNQFDGTQDSAITLLIRDVNALNHLVKLINLKNDASTLRILAQAIITMTEKNGINALHMAASFPDNDQVIELLLKGADQLAKQFPQFSDYINHQCSVNQNTAAHYAVKSGSLPNFIMLKRHHADLKRATNEGVTPIDMIRYIPVEKWEPDRNHKFVAQLLETDIGMSTFFERYGQPWRVMQTIQKELIGLEISVRQNTDAKPQYYVFATCTGLLRSGKLSDAETKVILSMLNHVNYRVLDKRSLEEDIPDLQHRAFFDQVLTSVSWMSASPQSTLMNEYIKALVLVNLLTGDLPKQSLVYNELLKTLSTASNETREGVMASRLLMKLTQDQQDELMSLPGCGSVLKI